jgi:lipopolysaccharide transport system permease protein
LPSQAVHGFGSGHLKGSMITGIVLVSRDNSPSPLRKWAHLRDVLRVLVARDFKLRYKRSVFGVGWSLMVPLAQLAVLYLVFNEMVPLNIPRFSAFLFTGILPWNWLQTALLMSALTVVDNRDLIKQVGFPVALLPTITVFSQFIHFLLALPILAVFLVMDGYRPDRSLVALPLVVLFQFALILSLAYIVATLQVKFRDTQYLLGIVLFLGFYLTPIFWDAARIPDPYRTIMNFNPVAVLLNAYRAILVNGKWPDFPSLLAVGFGSIVFLVVGYALFSFARNRFVEEL